ncbi:MAG: coenzyme F420-0:L-glutamate ligase [Defluviitaleaceae bacterium]|nr:coenzyme F420-0:L-glutamate ligase [Defluviitaleaceae bacterium]
MISGSISINEIPNFPRVNYGCNLPDIIVEAIRKSNFKLAGNDILCVASKAVSVAENRVVRLDDVTPGELAKELHERVKRKDPRVIQLIIDETGDRTGGRLEIHGNWIGGWLPNGLFLTSAGIDKIDGYNVILLPENPDKSAEMIGKEIYESFGIKAGVVITDSDGRADKAGSNQIAVGVYGVPALRNSFTVDGETGEKSEWTETLCDLLAAAAALVMGQRGTGKPVVRISGLEYDFDENSKIQAALPNNAV